MDDTVERTDLLSGTASSSLGSRGGGQFFSIKCLIWTLLLWLVVPGLAGTRPCPFLLRFALTEDGNITNAATALLLLLPLLLLLIPPMLLLQLLLLLLPLLLLLLRSCTVQTQNTRSTGAQGS